MPALVVIGATASASHDGPGAVPRSYAAGTGASAAAHGSGAADAAADATDGIIEVFGDANFAGCNCTRKSTVGGVAMWSGQIAKAWSNTMGVLALSSGESELAAVVRAATEGMGRMSMWNDFCLCGHVAIKSDATALIGIVRPLGLGKVRHVSVGDLWVHHHVRSGKI